MSRTTFIEVPVELLPEIVELLTVAYGRLTEKIEKKDRLVSDLQFDVAKLNNRITALTQEKAVKEDDNDDF